MKKFKFVNSEGNEEPLINQDTYSYNGWLVSDKFYKRLLAFLGYNIALGMLYIIIVYSAAFIFNLIRN